MSAALAGGGVWFVLILAAIVVGMELLRSEEDPGDAMDATRGQ